jgi:hypothetical protein
MVWFGRFCAITQLASRVGGEGELDKILSISLHYLAQGESQGGGKRSNFLPLDWDHLAAAVCASAPDLESPGAG